MSYLAWRMTFQDAEQAARSAYRSWEVAVKRVHELEERIRDGEQDGSREPLENAVELNSSEDIQSSIT